MSDSESEYDTGSGSEDHDAHDLDDVDDDSNDDNENTTKKARVSTDSSNLPVSSGKDGTNGSTPSRKQQKMKVKLLNKELAELAKSKQLKAGLKLFHTQIQKRGLMPDAHTYANLINLYVRCGDVDGAMGVLAEMTQPQQSAPAVKPNVVIYTTLLKGLCESGEMERAKELFYTSILHIPVPNSQAQTAAAAVTSVAQPRAKKTITAADALNVNIRSLNTYLRGCVRNGKVLYGIEAFEHFKQLQRSRAGASSGDTAEITNNESGKPSEKKSKNKKKRDRPSAKAPTRPNADLQFDSTTYEYMTMLLTQSFRSSEANTLISSLLQQTQPQGGHGDSNVDNVLENSYLFYYLARMYGHLGHKEECLQWCTVCESSLEASKHTHVKTSIMNKLSLGADTAGGADSRQMQRRGGDRGHSKQSSTKSIDLFLQHRRLELEQLIADLKEFVSIVRVDTDTLSQLVLQAAAESVEPRTDVANKKKLIKRQQQLSELAELLLTGPKSSAGNYRVAEHMSFQVQQRFRIMDVLSRLFWFEHENSTSIGDDVKLEDHESLINALIKNLTDEYGLSNICTVSPDTKSEAKNDALPTLLKVWKRQALARIVRSMQPQPTTPAQAARKDNCFINFAEVFEEVPGFSSRPIKMEICSGSGEWVCAQALADREASSGTALANWVALELRADRVFNIVSTCALSSVPMSLAAMTASSTSVPTSSSNAPPSWKYSTQPSNVGAHAKQYRRLVKQHEIRLQKQQWSQRRDELESQEKEGPNTIAADSITPTEFEGADADEGESLLPSAQWLQRMGFVRNLCVLGGNAMHILPQRISPRSISAIFINHPEPPERLLGVGESVKGTVKDGTGKEQRTADKSSAASGSSSTQGKHLLTAEFFLDMHRVLVDDGTITIVTDNLAYAKYLVEILALQADTKLKQHGHDADSIAYMGFCSVKLDVTNTQTNRVNNSETAFPRSLEAEVILHKPSEPTSSSVSSSMVVTGHPSTSTEVAENDNEDESSDSESSGASDSDSDSDDEGVCEIVTYSKPKPAPTNPRMITSSSSVKREQAGPRGGKVSGDQLPVPLPVPVGKHNKAAALNPSVPADVDSVERSAVVDSSNSQVLQIWRAERPGPEAGHVCVNASSYFDRMWSRGQKKRRWFIYLKKL
jgi:pentatricopeptide repeat protein